MAAKGQTLKEFGNLYPAESKLLAACRDGEAAIIAKSRPEALTPESYVRADFVRFLARGGAADAPVHEMGVNLRGAVVVGTLNLAGVSVPHPLWLHECRFQNPDGQLADLILQGASLEGGLSLRGSQVNGLYGTGLRAWGDIHFSMGFRAAAAVQLPDAQIEGTLVCRGGHFCAPDGNALVLDRANVSGDVFLDNSFEATGPVRFVGATISGDLDCSGAKLTPTQGDALSFDGAKIAGCVFLNDNFEAAATLRFLGATIGGDLTCSGAKLTPTTGPALSFSRANISGSVFLIDSFEATGEVRFLGATIGGTLTCSGAKLTPTTGEALVFDAANISGSVFLDGSFEAMGEVRFVGATIGGNLECVKAHFQATTGRALTFERAKIGGSVSLRNGFHAEGAVVLSSAEIGAWLDLSDATITGGFDANHAIIQHTFKLTSRRRELPNVEAQPILSGANLRHMQCGSLHDDKTSWGKGNHLNGFTYRSLAHEAPTEPKFRRDWLKDQSPDSGSYRPQPWRHLQKTLKAMGHDAEAREIGIAHEKERRDRRIVGARITGNLLMRALSYPAAFLERRLHWLYGAMTGYGYKPFRLAYILTAVWLVFGLFYQYAATQGYLGPSNPLVFQNAKYGAQIADCQISRTEDCLKIPAKNWYYLDPLPAEYATFSPFGFSLDVLLPVVDLGQEKEWGALVPTPKQGFWEELQHFSWPHAVRLAIWSEILFGWVASLMLVAVISGMARNIRDDE